MSIKRKPRADLALYLTYLCVVLAVLLSLAQLYLYGLRYRAIFDDTTYQAVALTNGQTYFGVLKKYGPKTYILEDVYYLQATPVTEPTADSDAASAEETTDSNLQLIKLIDEVHQPKNFLVLNRDHIIFWQHLQLDSPIIEAIRKDKAGTS